MFVEPLEKGNGYGELGKCIHISILNFELFEEDDEFYSRFHLWEDERKRMYSDKLEIHTLELPKLMKHKYPESILLNWAKFLNAEKKEELEAMAKTNEYIEKAYQELVQLSADKKKRKEYEEREKNLRDYYHQMKYSFLDGIEEGEERISKLNLLLLEEKRYDDLEKVAKDQEYRKKLFDEFNL